MEIRRIRALRGPNLWSRKPVLEAWVDLGELKDTASNEVPGFTDRLMAWVPSLIEHRCSVGERGGFLKRLQDGTYPAHILEHLTLEMQSLAGSPTGFGKARETSTEGVYRVVVRYREEQVARAALLLARELFLAALRDQPFDLPARIAALKDLVEEVSLGPSTAAIVAAAEARGIPTRRLNTGSLVQLGQGARQHRIWTAETDGTSAIAESIAHDKELTKQLLRAGGVPVPDGRLVESADDAWEAAQDLGGPVVVKPVDANHGRGVHTNLRAEQEIRVAYANAITQGSGVLVETFAQGSEHRLLVVGNALIAAARGDIAEITGDGEHTVRVLVEQQLNSDPRRGFSHNSPLTPIEFDEPTVLLLASQGVTPDSVPAAGKAIVLQHNGNLRIDVTDEVHPTTAAHVVLAARIVGLDIAGIDVVATDISKPLESQGGVIVEVNSSPGLHAHLMPGVGKPRPVGEAIVARLFAPGENGRVPIACVTGTNGKTTVVRLLEHLLGNTGKRLGSATTDGVTVAGRIIERGDCGGPRSARKVLMHPDVDVALLEAGRGGILREGLGFDKCNVAIVTNIAEADHLGQLSVETPEDMYGLKRCPVDVVFPDGTAVLNADDALVAKMAALSDGAVILFAREATNAHVVEHVSAGKKALFEHDGWLVLADGPARVRLVETATIPLTLGGRAGFQVENVLAAIGGALGLGLTLEAIRDRLLTAVAPPARGSVFELRGTTVIVDDSHNTSALAALITTLDRFPATTRTAVYSAASGRRDADLVRQGEQLGAAFDRVILFEDATAEDRAEGEITRLFRQGLAAATRAKDIFEVRDHRAAVEAALDAARAGELVFVQAEDGAPEAAEELVRARLR